MFIYHFNRLIHNRLLWIIFAVVVAFAFLSVDSCTSGGGRSGRTAGKLAGKTVDESRFDFAQRFVSGGRGRADDMPPALVETQAWRHLAALHTAEKMRLSSTPDEIRQAIRDVPAFSNAGRFDANVYRQMIAQSLGVTPAVYEQLMADQIALTKIMQAIGAAGLVSEMEIDDELASWTDRFTIQHATISNRFARTSIDLDDDALRAYYAENRAAFTLPDRVGVRYAAVAVSNFFDTVVLHEDDIEEYYDSNASRFTHTTTNDILETLKLEEVRSEIVADLTRDEARYIAGTNAAAFMEALATADADQFTWRAKARKMIVSSTPLFADDEPVPGIEAEAQEEFRNAAFDLDPLRLDARFAVVPGRDWVYLLMAWTNSPAFTPDFETVRDRLQPLALAQAREKAFNRLCQDERDALKSALEQGQDFAAAAAAQSMNVSTSVTFSVQSSSRAEFPNANALIPAVMRLRAGELSEAVPVVGGALIACVIDRQPGDAITSAMVRSQIRDALLRRRESAIVDDWMPWNLDAVGFTSARAAAFTAVDEATDSEATDEDDDDR